jgi:hypothetical protein
LIEDLGLLVLVADAILLAMFAFFSEGFAVLTWITVGAFEEK